jgi:hypothetical protein
MEHDTGSGAGQGAPPGAPEQADQAATGATASTGEPRVDAAVLRLAELDDLPLSEHPAVYERVHEELVEVLGDLHAGQGQAGQGQAGESQPGQGQPRQAGSRREDT